MVTKYTAPEAVSEVNIFPRGMPSDPPSEEGFGVLCHTGVGVFLDWTSDDNCCWGIFLCYGVGGREEIWV